MILGFGGLIWVAAWLMLTRGADLATCHPCPRPTNSGRVYASQASLAFNCSLDRRTRHDVQPAGYSCPTTWRGAAVWWGVAVFMIGLSGRFLLIMPQEWLAGADWATSLGEIVRLPRFWVTAAVGITINVTWHFLVNWMALFFQEGRSLGMLVGGMVTALPFVAAGLGNLGGGSLIRLLTRHGMTTAAARKLRDDNLFVTCEQCSLGRDSSESEALIDCPALPGRHGHGGLHGQLLCFRSGCRPEPHGTGDRVSRRTGQPVRGRVHARCRLDLPGPFRLHSQLHHYRPASFGRTGRPARVLAPGRRKTSLDGSLAFWHHSRLTLQTFPFQGIRPVRGTRPVLNPTTSPVSSPS